MAQLENDTVYLESRGVPGTFHWGIFIASSAPGGQYYHATTKFGGGWQLEVKPTSNALDSTTLVLAYKIGQILSPNHVDQVLRGLPADGSPSLRTGEGFNCRTWVKDALMTLHNDCLLDLSADIDTLERRAFAAATPLEPEIERGVGRAAVLDSSPSSSSSS